MDKHIPSFALCRRETKEKRKSERMKRKKPLVTSPNLQWWVELVMMDVLG
jgi:hypothetical protein